MRTRRFVILLATCAAVLSGCGAGAGLRQRPVATPPAAQPKPALAGSAVHPADVGGGDAVESPNSAASVRIVPLAPEMSSFAGARRIL